jgi:uncharacterized membrane protein YhaH (DUF805 family)
VDDARRRWLPDDEASVASRAAAVQLLRTWSPFRFQGRLGRGAYALALVAWHAACAIGTGVAFTVVLLVARIVGGPEALNAVVLPTILVVALAYVVGLVGYAVRRLHDLSRSGAWAAIGFVPFVGFVFLAYLLFAPGTEGANAFGDAPPRPVAVTVGAPTAALAAGSPSVTEAQLEAAFDDGRRFAERGRGGA